MRGGSHPIPPLCRSIRLPLGCKFRRCSAGTELLSLNNISSTSSLHAGRLVTPPEPIVEGPNPPNLFVSSLNVHRGRIWGNDGRSIPTFEPPRADVLEDTVRCISHAGISGLWSETQKTRSGNCTFCGVHGVDRWVPTVFGGNTKGQKTERRTMDRYLR